MVRCSLVLQLFLVGSAFAAEPRNNELERATTAIVEQRYELANRLLDGFLQKPGHPRAALLKSLELMGIAQAELGQAAKAKASFQQLLSLEPGQEITLNVGPKTQRAFAEAQKWAKNNPPLDATPEPAASDDKRRIRQIALKIANDPLKWVKRARFWTRVGGDKWKQQETEVIGAYASANTDSESLDWYAELLSDRGQILKTVGTAKAPIHEEVPAPPPVTQREETPNDAPVADPRPPKVERLTEQLPDEPNGPVILTREEVQPHSSQRALRRKLSYVALGLGLANMVAATVMGSLWQTNVSTLRQALDTANRDNEGKIINFEGLAPEATQGYYLGMSNRIQTQAITANVLWGLGAGFALTGGILYWFNREPGNAY